MGLIVAKEVSTVKIRFVHAGHSVPATRDAIIYDCNCITMMLCTHSPETVIISPFLRLPFLLQLLQVYLKKAIKEAWDHYGQKPTDLQILEIHDSARVIDDFAPYKMYLVEHRIV